MLPKVLGQCKCRCRHSGSNKTTAFFFTDPYSLVNEKNREREREREGGGHGENEKILKCKKSKGVSSVNGSLAELCCGDSCCILVRYIATREGVQTRTSEPPDVDLLPRMFPVT